MLLRLKSEILNAVVKSNIRIIQIKKSTAQMSSTFFIAILYKSRFDTSTALSTLNV